MEFYAFVMMPFSSDFIEIREAIRVAGSTTNVRVYFADESNVTGEITLEMKSEIRKSHFCIADISGKNPNVSWEDGFAEALGKKVIPLARSASDFFFDVKDKRTIIYDKKNLELSLSQKLIDRINQIKKDLSFVSPEVLIGTREYEQLSVVAAARNLPESKHGFFELISMAKHQIFIAAQNHFFFVRDYENRIRFEDAVVKFLSENDKAKINVMICDDQCEHAIKTWEFVVNSKMYHEHLSASVSYFSSLVEKLNKKNEFIGRFSMKKIDFVPLSMNFIDPDSENGIAVMVPNTFESRNTSRPCYLISKRENPFIFQEYWSIYNHQYTSILDIEL